MSKTEKIWFGLGVTVMLLLVVAIGDYFYSKYSVAEESLGGSYGRLETLVGSSGDAEKLPSKYVNANSTSTNPVFDGGTVTQKIVTTGVDTVRLNFLGVGLTATGTVSVKPEVSYDGTNFFPLMYTTTTGPLLTGNGTTTPSINGYKTTFIPGVTTSTWSYDYKVTGSQYVRFLISGPNDADGDNKENTTDYVQAWIEAVAIDTF